jgi:hypothetical protein
VNGASDFWNVLECCQRNIWFVKLPKNVLFFLLNAEAFFSVNAKFFVSECCCGETRHSVVTAEGFIRAASRFGKRELFTQYLNLLKPSVHFMYHPV